MSAERFLNPREAGKNLTVCLKFLNHRACRPARAHTRAPFDVAATPALSVSTRPPELPHESARRPVRATPVRERAPLRPLREASQDRSTIRSLGKRRVTMSADTSHDSEDFSEIEMDELDSYLTSPPVRPADPPLSRDARASRPPSSSPPPRNSPPPAPRPRASFQIVPLGPRERRG